jgi:hypothetical protein
MLTGVPLRAPHGEAATGGAAGGTDATDRRTDVVHATRSRRFSREGTLRPAPKDAAVLDV